MVTAPEHRAGIDELEALYKLQAREPDHGLG